MRHLAWTCLSVLSGLASASVPKASVELDSATLLGSSSDGVESFHGIPYAEPPVGPLRLKPPRKHSGSIKHDVRGKTPACPQMTMSRASAALVFKAAPAIAGLPFWNTVQGQEDCLTVSVQRPAKTRPGAGLPVLFWIHGGFYEVGGGNAYDARHLLGTAVGDGLPFIYVAVNHRLGGFGFMPGAEILADGSANLGLLDQRMALEWVADNIHRFGGDPDRVTVWGESAGAYSVLNQMALYDGDATYKSKPLFRGAILNSGSILSADPVDCPKGQAVYDAVVRTAGCHGHINTLSCLRGVDYATYLNATSSVPGFLSYTASALSYLPRPDGRVLTASVEELVESGRYHAVPMLISDQEDEGTLFSVFQQSIKTDDDLVKYLAELYFHNAEKERLRELVEAYPGNRQGSPFRTGSSDVLYPYFKRVAALIGDYTFTLARRKFLELAIRANPGTPAWSCRSSSFHGTPVVGTFHTSDLAQLFYDTSPTPATLHWRRYYNNFLHTLDPNKGRKGCPRWPLWKADRTLLWFKTNSTIGFLRDDFRSEAFEIWSSMWNTLRQ